MLSTVTNISLPAIHVFVPSSGIFVFQIVNLVEIVGNVRKSSWFFSSILYHRQLMCILEIGTALPLKTWTNVFVRCHILRFPIVMRIKIIIRSMKCSF